jgi:hypothetical protein
MEIALQLVSSMVVGSHAHARAQRHACVLSCDAHQLVCPGTRPPSGMHATGRVDGRQCYAYGMYVGLGRWVGVNPSCRFRVHVELSWSLSIVSVKPTIRDAASPKHACIHGEWASQLIWYMRTYIRLIYTSDRRSTSS